MTKDSAGFIARIKTRRRIFPLLFLPPWFALWTFGGVSTAAAWLRGDPPAFPIIWLCGWAAAEVFGIVGWFWNAFGKEIVAINRGFFTHKRDVLGYGLSKTFPLGELSNLRAAGSFGSPGPFSSSLAQWGITGGAVAVDRPGGTFRFGYNLEEAEANALVEEMKTYLGVDGVRRSHVITDPTNFSR